METAQGGAVDPQVVDHAGLRLLVGPALRAADRHAQRLARRSEDQSRDHRRAVVDRAFATASSSCGRRWSTGCQLPLLERLGRRKSWIMLCQAVMIAGLRRARRDQSGDEYRHLRDLRGDRRARVGDAGRRGRRVADRRRRRADAGRTALRRSTSSATASRRIVGGALALVLAARMSWSLVYLLMGGLIALMVARRAPGAGHPRPDTGVLHKELDGAGRARAAGPRRRPGHRRRQLGLGDLHDRPFHGLDADHRAGRASSRRSPTSPSIMGRGSSSRR